jgi:hypothetical protein
MVPVTTNTSSSISSSRVLLTWTGCSPRPLLLRKQSCSRMLQQQGLLLVPRLRKGLRLRQPSSSRQWTLLPLRRRQLQPRSRQPAVWKARLLLHSVG